MADDVLSARAAPGTTPDFLAVAASDFLPRHLIPETVTDYLACGPDAAAVAHLIEPFDFSRPPYPLEFCEFLAYKSVLAYAPGSEIEANLERGCRGYVKGSFEFFDSAGKKKGDTQGFGFQAYDTAFIVMRGTTSFKDWLDNLSAKLTTDDGVSEKTAAAVGGRHPARHLGFARAWANVAADIRAWIGRLASRPGASVRQCCFSGHSLGGALALIGAHDFARTKTLPVAAVVTFAAPKVGEEAFGADYKALGLVERTLRLETPEDAVPTLAISSQAFSPGVVASFVDRPMIGGWEKFNSALLGIAGWTKTKPTEVPASPDAELAAAKSDAPAQAGASKPAPTDTAAKPADGKPAPAEAKPATEISPAKAIAIVLAIVAVIVLFLIARRVIIRLRAHGAANRYALYLTTLSYQNLRRFNALAPGGLDPRTGKPQAAALDAAWNGLTSHLAQVRGPSSAAFKSLKKRPVKITEKNFDQLLTESTEAYKGYIW